MQDGCQSRPLVGGAVAHIVQTSGKALAMGDVLRHPLGPPGGAIEGIVAKAAVLVEAAVEIVNVLVAQVPHLEGRAFPLGLIGKEAGLIAGASRISLDVDAAIVGGDAKEGAAVPTPVGGRAEDHQLQRLVVIIRHRLFAGFHQLVEMLLFLTQLAADPFGLSLGKILGAQAQGRRAGVLEGQDILHADRGAEPGKLAADTGFAGAIRVGEVVAGEGEGDLFQQGSGLVASRNQPVLAHDGDDIAVELLAIAVCLVRSGVMEVAHHLIEAAVGIEDVVEDKQIP